MGFKSFAALASSGYQAKRATTTLSSPPPPPACSSYTYASCTSGSGTIVYYNSSYQFCCVDPTSGQRIECNGNDINCQPKPLPTPPTN